MPAAAKSIAVWVKRRNPVVGLHIWDGTITQLPPAVRVNPPSEMKCIFSSLKIIRFTSKERHMSTAAESIAAWVAQKNVGATLYLYDVNITQLPALPAGLQLLLPGSFVFLLFASRIAVPALH